MDLDVFLNLMRAFQFHAEENKKVFVGPALPGQGKSSARTMDVFFNDVESEDNDMASKETEKAPPNIFSQSTPSACVQTCTRARSTSQSSSDTFILSGSMDAIIQVAARGKSYALYQEKGHSPLAGLPLKSWSSGSVRSAKSSPTLLEEAHSRYGGWSGPSH